MTRNSLLNPPDSSSLGDTLSGFRITRLRWPQQRVIGDSQVRSTTHWMLVLELVTGGGLVGTGFLSSLFAPFPGRAELEAGFARQFERDLRGQIPQVLINRLERPRGGRIAANPFRQPIQQALWDLAAQQHGLPLFRLLGGTDPRVRAYASGLEFHLDDAAVVAFYQRARERGFTAFKVKVGHPDLAWDLARLRLVADVVGPGAQLMVDANEAWSPKEAVRRVHAFRDAGFELLWVEDPCLRDDFAGLRSFRESVPFSALNSGEYLDLHGKRQLIEAGAVDILNLHGTISDSLHAAWLALEHGLQVTFGNTTLELGAHLAAALPESTWIECSLHGNEWLVDQPFAIRDGAVFAAERPGHGLTLSEHARQTYAVPTAD